MIRLAKHNESIIEKGYRILKTFGRSKRDVSTSYQVSSWGDDSCPLPNSDVAHAQTATDDTVVLGVINKNPIAKAGEKRIFATDGAGDVVVAIYLKNDGTIEIAGNTDNVVKFSPLDTAMQGLIFDINEELVKIQAGITGVGGTYTPTPLSLDLSEAKNDTIKTN